MSAQPIQPRQPKPCPNITLNDGNEIPQIGLGVYRATGKTLENALESAHQIGYRHFDTASFYENEETIGKFMKSHSHEIPRKHWFITSKVWRDQMGYEGTKKACELALPKLNTDYIDLYILHCPEPKKWMDAYRALEDLKDEGKVKSIGVSNFGTHHLQRLLRECRYKPTVNQIEVTPFLPRVELVDYCQNNNIAIEAYSPLTKGEKLKGRGEHHKELLRRNY